MAMAVSQDQRKVGSAQVQRQRLHAKCSERQVTTLMRPQQQRTPGDDRSKFEAPGERTNGVLESDTHRQQEKKQGRILYAFLSSAEFNGDKGDGIVDGCYRVESPLVGVSINPRVKGSRCHYHNCN